MKILSVLHDAPLANEKAYNALRIAAHLQKEGHAIFIYLIADGVYCALRDQKTAAAASNIGGMITEILKNGGEVKMCTSCGNARGIAAAPIIDGTQWTNLKTLTDWMLASDKVISY
jgi:uncharacterized protein involved in oxidation of intracellular sulfur